MSTPRFMLLWALTAAPLHLAWGWLHQNFDSTFVTYVIHGTLALLMGLLQFALLARYRARVRFWPLALLCGWLVSAALSYAVYDEMWRHFRFPQDLRVVNIFYSIVWGGTRGLSLGAALGLALWGRRWNSTWPLWITGLLILETGTSILLTMVFPWGHLMGWPIDGAIEAAGMAWLLDRLVFRAAGKPA